MEAEMAETGIKLPKLVKDRFNRVKEEINASDLSQEMHDWLAQMQMTEESIKADFMPEKSEKQSLTKHYYHTDQIGTPLALVNEEGEIDWEIVIDPYGNRVREENPNKMYQPIRMQGQHFDAESNIHYNRHRYYDPKQGRYISQDPIGLSGGINNYIYSLNPNQMVDPLGLLAPAIPWGIGVIIGGGLAAGGNVGIEGEWDLKMNPTIPATTILGPMIVWDRIFGNTKADDVAEQARKREERVAALQAAASRVKTCTEIKTQDGCPPCVTISGKVVSIGTVGYRPLDVISDNEKQHGVYGSHHNIAIASQSPAFIKKTM